MSRKKKWPPTVHHHKPSGQARVRIDGKDIYLGPYGSAEADAALIDLLKRYRDGPPEERIVTGELTVFVVVARWEKEVAPTISDRGRERKAFHRALTVLLRTCGTEPAASFDAGRLEQVRQKMIDGTWRTPAEREEHEKRYASDWCRNVVNRAVVRIKTVWRWAERKSLVPKNSWQQLRTLPSLADHDKTVRQTEAVKPADKADLDKVLKEVRREAVKVMLRLQWLAGMRPGEVRKMKAGEVDQSSDPWLFRPKEHKNDWRNHERVVPLGKEAQTILEPWLKGKQPDVYVFQSTRRPGQCYTSMTYAQAVRRAAERAGLPGFHSYMLRHGAKRRLTREFGLDVARAVLGQKSLGTTNEYASELDLKLATDAVQAEDKKKDEKKNG